MYDVIIVGGGPSGSMAAYYLAVRGRSVLLLDKAAFPRNKICGGGLTHKAIRKIPFDISPMAEVRARGGMVAFKGKSLVKFEAPDVAYLVRRETFDHFLVQKAVSVGTVLHEACSVSSIELEPDQVSVVTNKGSFTGKFLIGADGANSLIARQFGLLKDRQKGIALEAEFEVPPEILKSQGPYSTFDFGAMPGGYGWIFPKEGRLSIGVFYASTKKRPNLRQDFDRYVSMHPQIASHGVTNIHGHPIPLGGQKEPRQKGRILLVGDAANLADPWVGEGISYAIYSAEIAAGVIEDCLKNNSGDLHEYDQRIYKTFIKQFVYARAFAALVYRFPRFSSNLLSRSITMQKLISGNLRGNYSFEQLSWHLLLNLPRIFFEAITLKGFLGGL
jgi:geranylgeranyl reductase family protein